MNSQITIQVKVDYSFSFLQPQLRPSYGEVFGEIVLEDGTSFLRQHRSEMFDLQHYFPNVRGIVTAIDWEQHYRNEVVVRFVCESPVLMDHGDGRQTLFIKNSPPTIIFTW